MPEENIFHSPLEEEIRQSYLNYAMSVITDRSLPDVRDGLKPVHRRILWAMFVNKFFHNKPYKKSAKTVGDVIGMYHPHGDISVYDAMVRLSQWFSVLHPLIDVHGNGGSIDGDPAAAMRYTEARMAEIGDLMTQDVKKDTVDMKLNFSEDILEPTVLTSRFPNLIVNGTTGIAVAMACSFPSHNLKTSIEGITEYIRDNEVSDEKLYEIIGGPDFPTGGLVINEHELLDGYKTGRGRIRIRGEYEMGKRGRKHIIKFVSIPYMVKKEKLISDIVKLIESKFITGVTDVRDESTTDIAIVIELNNLAIAEEVIAKIYKKTQMEGTFSINNTCIVDGEPKTLSMKGLVEQYVSFQQQVIYRRTEFEANKLRSRIHILEGLVIALADIDNVIALIKQSSSTKDAKEKLMTKYKIDEAQANAILSMKLSRLTKLEIKDLEKDLKIKHVELSKLNLILDNKVELNKVLIAELNEIKVKHTQERRTKIVNIVTPTTAAEKKVIPPRDIRISIDKSYIAREYKKETALLKRSSLYLLTTTTHDRLLIFTESGQIVPVKIDTIENTINLKTIVKGKILFILSSSNKSDSCLLFATRNGMLKKTHIRDYTGTKRKGSALKLKENDKLIKIIPSKGEFPVLMMSEKGMGICFNTDFTSTGKVAMGVKGIKLKEGDYFASMTLMNKEYLNIVTSGGSCGRLLKDSVSCQGRNGVGIKLIKVAKDDKILNVFTTLEKNSIIVLTDKSITNIENSMFPIIEKGKSGKKVIVNRNFINVIGG